MDFSGNGKNLSSTVTSNDISLLGAALLTALDRLDGLAGATERLSAAQDRATARLGIIDHHLQTMDSKVDNMVELQKATTKIRSRQISNSATESDTSLRDDVTLSALASTDNKVDTTTNNKDSSSIEEQ